MELQEIIYAASETIVSRRITKLENDGLIRKLAPRIYTSNFDDTTEEIIRKNVFQIIGKLFPKAVLSHRTALEFKPTKSNLLFVTYKYTKKYELPGITIQFLEGAEPLKDDNAMFGNLHVSQKARAFLENMQTTRKIGDDSKTLPFPVIEEKLEQIIRVNGEDELNKVRDKARKIAKQIGLEKEFGKLNRIIGALLSTKPATLLKSPVAAARAFGVPYDNARLQLFQELFIELKQRTFKLRPEKNTTKSAYRNFAFFESYFSNYIEGTRFDLNVAKEIIETEKPLATRNDDSHDILGTYEIVSNQKIMKTTPKDGDDFLKLLQQRHKVLLSARTSKKPGQFKDLNNYAGQTAFVDLTLVRGTLLKGFEFYHVLENPFAKAIYIMFLITEVHPFLDGNGRVARVMMNVELSAQNQTKIIVPTVFRDDYNAALRKITRQKDIGLYIKMMSKLHEFSDAIFGDSSDEMKLVLTESNAFLEPDEGKLKIIN